MFKRSFILVLSILTLVFASALTTQVITAKSLPSAYDSGLTIEQAFKTAKTPLLIEFYTDSCGTCRKVTPLVHETHKQYRDRLTLVMVNLEDSNNDGIAQLFGVRELPGVFVFDFKKMKKHQIAIPALKSAKTLQQALDKAMAPAS